jgi:hypothetical protein
VYQLNVAPGKRRKLVGAALVKAAFERCPYGVKLFCCWCAQDIEANHFWESIGFVPIAFRTGSRGRGKNAEPRIHIFWQRRIREGDTETPYWFPSETSGARCGRIVWCCRFRPVRIGAMRSRRSCRGWKVLGRGSSLVIPAKAGIQRVRTKPLGPRPPMG